MSDKTLNHRGYCGSIEFSIEDSCLYGKILFITDLVTYEAETILGLSKAFEEAVDFYLAKCEQVGLIADKPFSGTFNVRFDPELHRSAAIAAAKKGASLNDFVRECVEHCLSDKTTLVSLTENHTHYHQVELVESEKYEEDPTTSWSQKQPSQQKQSVPLH